MGLGFASAGRFQGPEGNDSGRADFPAPRFRCSPLCDPVVAYQHLATLGGGCDLLTRWNEAPAKGHRRCLSCCALGKGAWKGPEPAVPAVCEGKRKMHENLWPMAFFALLVSETQHTI